MTTKGVEVKVTREQWLLEAVGLLRDRFLPEAPADLLVSVGWPGGRGNKEKVIGQHWPQRAPKRSQIFISPVLIETQDVLSTLLHEMIHASCPPETKHGGEFIVLAKRVGFKAPWTSTPLTEELVEALSELQVEPYQHEKLEPIPKSAKQSTRQLKVVCPECGYTLRATRKWLNVGLPSCPCGTVMEESE